MADTIFEHTLLAIPSLAQKNPHEMRSLAAALLDFCGTNIKFKQQVCHGIFSAFPVLAAQYPMELPYITRTLLDRCHENTDLEQKILDAALTTFPTLALRHYPEVAPFVKTLLSLPSYKDSGSQQKIRDAALAVLPKLLHDNVTACDLIETLLDGRPITEKLFIAGRMANGDALVVAPSGIGEGRIRSAIIAQEGEISFSLGHIRGTADELTAQSEHLHGKGTPKHKENINFIKAAVETAQNMSNLRPISAAISATIQEFTLAPKDA